MKSKFLPKLLKVALLGVVVFAAIAFFFYYQRQKAIDKLKDQASYLIGKIEDYRKAHRKLPRYESDMQLNLPGNSPIGYTLTTDSVNYIITVQIAPFKSMVYHSDAKSWLQQY